MKSASVRFLLVLKLHEQREEGAHASPHVDIENESERERERVRRARRFWEECPLVGEFAVQQNDAWPVHLQHEQPCFPRQ